MRKTTKFYKRLILFLPLLFFIIVINRSFAATLVNSAESTAKKAIYVGEKAKILDIKYLLEFKDTLLYIIILTIFIFIGINILLFVFLFIKKIINKNLVILVEMKKIISNLFGKSVNILLLIIIVILFNISMQLKYYMTAPTTWSKLINPYLRSISSNTGCETGDIESLLEDIKNILEYK